MPWSFTPKKRLVYITNRGRGYSMFISVALMTVHTGIIKFCIFGLQTNAVFFLPEFYAGSYEAAFVEVFLCGQNFYQVYFFLLEGKLDFNLSAGGKSFSPGSCPCTAVIVCVFHVLVLYEKKNIKTKNKKCKIKSKTHCQISLCDVY